MLRTRLTAAVSAALIALAAPVAAQQAPRAIARSDLQQAAQQHPELVGQFGGEVKGPLAEYVSSVGRRVASQTNVANAPEAYRFTVLDSPVRNAFAVPGGYIYITRGLLALMNSEDELAFVLGHEMGHVAARHGQKRQTRGTLTSLGAALAQVLTGSDIVGQVAGQVGQGLLAGYSRSQENESDRLGVRYIAAAGFDPYAAPNMLATMSAAENLDLAGKQQTQLPSWSRTHPLSSERVQRTRSLAGQARAAVSPSLQSRDRFLSVLDGTIVGDDPRQGVIEGRQFRHPGLRFRFTAPAGYEITNSSSAVTVAGAGGQAQFGTGRLSGRIEDYVGQVFRSLAGGGGSVRLPAVQTATINAMPVAYATTRATANNRPVDVTVVAYRWGPDTAYHFITLTPAGAGIGPFRDMVYSLAPMSASEAAGVRHRVIDVVTVGRGDTVRSLAARMAYPDLQVERFLVLNGLDAGDTLQPGSRVKLVTYSD